MGVVKKFITFSFCFSVPLAEGSQPGVPASVAVVMRAKRKAETAAPMTEKRECTRHAQPSCVWCEPDEENSELASALLVHRTLTCLAKTSFYQECPCPRRRGLTHCLDFNACCPASGLSPLVAAVAANDEELVELLVLQGANVNTPDLRKTTPLQEAVYQQNALPQGKYARMIQLLLKLGAEWKNIQRVRP